MNIQCIENKPTAKLKCAVIQSPYGSALIAWCDQGLSYLGFTKSYNDIKTRWPKAQLEVAQAPSYSDQIFLTNNWSSIPLCLFGSAFEHKVWQALLAIPSGTTRSYSDIATAIGKPSAQRAVASAIGRNPISLIIPCHRVIRASGELGGYHWGLSIKQKILKYERDKSC